MKRRYDVAVEQLRQEDPVEGDVVVVQWTRADPSDHLWREHREERGPGVLVCHSEKKSSQGAQG